MAQLKTLLVIGGAALAMAALPAPAQACHSGCTPPPTTTGGTDVPAPAAFGLFGAAALGLVARRRRARG
ncbi:MAG TPA: PEP-CTERM sorting domain-containing protein [Allosphingosinicella sp.]|nr:PEP-CTERM sorting domain-containing protein [Allosphingosinicella sp.]